MQDELIKAMSDEDLAGLKVKYAVQPSVATLIDSILEARSKEAEVVKVKVDFERGISKLFARLPHPEDIHNIYARWAEVDIPDGEPEEIEVNGEKVTRTPSHKDFQWVVQVNHAVKVTGGGGGSSPATSKRAITVYKRNGTQLELKGHYPSASKACEALGLTIGGDSANRVLARDSYIVEPYTGADYTT